MGRNSRTRPSMRDRSYGGVMSDNHMMVGGVRWTRPLDIMDGNWFTFEIQGWSLMVLHGSTGLGGQWIWKATNHILRPSIEGKEPTRERAMAMAIAATVV